jgi:two-component system, chemotaxis family, protein-glutamate methylesterase/glutaminase
MPSKVNVLIIDDSAFARLAISHALQSNESITISGSAKNGMEGIEKIKASKPDVVTLDVEMPDLDGLATLDRIMNECPVPVVMLSSLTGNGTETTIRALEMGAVDFFLKQSLANPTGMNSDTTDLSSKILMAARANISGKRITRNQTSSDQSKIKITKKKYPINEQTVSKLLIIGSSTGGPRALYEVIPRLPGDLPAAVMVVQHMPPGFTYSFANRLNELSNVTVKEAEPGDILRNGRVFIAPGSYHMVLDENGVLALNRNPPVCGVRPSVDVTMESAAKYFKQALFGVVLTGMGSDGTRGSGWLKKAGGKVIVEDKSTCVVWGMPKSVLDAGYADHIVPLPQIADEIVKMLGV